MNRTTPDLPEVSSWVELLEDRIAPATLNPASFHSAPVGSPILLEAGEGLSTSNSGGAYLLYVEKGQALVFTTDLNANGQLDANEITGIAAGNGLRLTSFVDVHGDIVTNLNANGTLTDSTPNDGQADGKLVLNSKIEALTLRSLTDADLNAAIPGETVANRSAPSTFSIYGNIYAGAGFGVVGGGLTIDTTGAVGGNATKVPAIGSILVGSATSGQYFSFGVWGDNTNQIHGLYGNLGQYKPANGVAGSDIIGVKAGQTTTTTTTIDVEDEFGNITTKTKTTNVYSSVDFTIGSLIAGDGGFGARGGNIQNVALKGDIGTFVAIAGNGGDGGNGGAGGSILNLTNGGSIWGYALLQSGDGGKGVVGKGGNGGVIQLGTFASSGKLDIILGNGGEGLTAGGTGSSFSGTIDPVPSTGDLEGLAVVSSKHVTGTIGKQNFIDFDGDGYSDLVYLSINPQQLVVIFGGSLGLDTERTLVLDVPTLESLSSSTAGLTVGDVNEDGHDDIIMATNSTRTSADLLTYLWNDDTQSFNLGIHSALPFFTQSIIGLEAGDFDGDGILDIGILNQSGGTGVYFAKGVADETGTAGSGLFFVDYGVNPTSGSATKAPVSGLSPNLGKAKIIATSASSGDTRDILVGAMLEDSIYNEITTFAYSGTVWSSDSVTGKYQKWVENPGYPASEPDPQNPDPANRYIRSGVSISLTPKDLTVIDIDGDGIFDIAAINSGEGQEALTLIQGAADSSISQPDPLGVILYGTKGVDTGATDKFQVVVGELGTFLGVNALPIVIDDPLNPGTRITQLDTFGISLVTASGRVGFYQFTATGFSQADVEVYSTATVSTALLPNPNGALFDVYRKAALNDDATLGEAAGYSLIALNNTTPQLLTTKAGSTGLASKNFELTAGYGGDSILGNGGTGGSILKLELNTSVGAAFITAGAGGNGTANGGVGGSLQNITIPSAGVVTLTAGVGGNGVSGNGGNGGSVSKFIISNGLQIAAGDGGTGNKGGNGGSIVGGGESIPINEASFTIPVSLIFTAGMGGSGILSGGNGGSILNYCVQIENNKVISLSYIAGKGGNAAAGRGGNGGSITGSSPANEENKFVGALEIRAGDGGFGLTGGHGGSISKFINSPSQFGVTPKLVSAIAGNGGSGVIGNGGNGGSLSGILVDGDGTDGTQVFNRFLAGNGGDSFGANGGAGGVITSLTTTSTGTSTAIAAGAGGDGLLKGGAGGGLGSISANSRGEESNAAYKVLAIAGAGGSAYAFTAASIFNPGATDFEKATAAFGGALGVGGNGGSINGFVQPIGEAVRTDLIAGNGGSTINHGSAIPGAKLYVGKGGSISNVNLAGNAGAASVADKNVEIESYNPTGSMSAFVKNALRDSPIAQLGTLGNVGVIVGVGGNIAGGLSSTSSYNGSVANFTARGIMSMVAGSVDSIASIVSISKLTVTNGPAGSAKDSPVSHNPSNPYYYDLIGGQSNTPILGGKLMDGAIIAKSFSASPSGPRVFTR